MIHAYDKVYLEKAQAVMARMLDFAVYDMGYDLEVFMNLFVSSGIAKRFGSGDFTLIAGKSGVELTYEVMEKANVPYERVLPNYSMNRSPEFWLGWALAYYQWHTGMTYNEIVQNVSVKELLALYSPYHEMDIHQFVDKVNEIYREKYSCTNLRRLRMNADLSQSKLAELTGIPVRTIQQYEQRQKNINNAKVDYLVRISRALHCDIELLIEKIQVE